MASPRSRDKLGLAAVEDALILPMASLQVWKRTDETRGCGRVRYNTHFCSALLVSLLLVAIMSSTVRTEETNVTSTNLAPTKAEKDEQVSSVKAGKSRATDENVDGDNEEEEEEYNEEEDEVFVRDVML